MKELEAKLVEQMNQLAVQYVVLKEQLEQNERARLVVSAQLAAAREVAKQPETKPE